MFGIKPRIKIDADQNKVLKVMSNEWEASKSEMGVGILEVGFNMLSLCQESDEKILETFKQFRKDDNMMQISRRVHELWKEGKYNNHDDQNRNDGTPPKQKNNTRNNIATT